ncbi:MAG: hypothetical protein Q4D41_11535 [Prevotellaceae bacterium]|nr:hypothetical protein [Prevotellaceae bacterium]
MKRNILTIFALSLAMAFCGAGLNEANAATELSDGEIIYSYNNGGSVYTYGTAKKENYDVAMHLTGADLAGTTITKVLIPIGDATTITNLKVWLSKALTLESKINVPDILSQDVTVSEDTIEVTLDSPYTLDADGVYVGYSFEIETLDSKNSYPIAVCSETTAGGFYIHSSRTFRSWIDRSSSSGDLAMGVVLSGVKANAAGISVPDIINVQTDKSQDVTLTISNHGYKGVQSFEYNYTVGGTTSESYTVDLGANALAARYNVSTDVDIELPALGLSDTNPITFTITKVNGETNDDASASAETSLVSYSYLPTHRAVMEEYTGTWCGYCPRGFVALEVMNKLYPDNFIGISYHNEDEMEIMSTSSYPSSVSGFPSAYLDRLYDVDPYYGFTSSEFGIDDAWLEVCESVLAPADLVVTGQLSDDEKYVNVNVATTFGAGLTNADYKIEFVLISDSLYDASWGQSNYYANEAYGTFPEEEFEQFTSGDSYVYGLKFNDVIIATSRLAGADAALPSTITGGTPIESTYTFDLSTVVSTYGNSLVQDVKNLRVVALLIDNTTGAIANANKAKVTSSTATGISSVNTDTTAEGKVEFYDISGRKYNSAIKGLNIMKTADGKVVKAYRK